MNKAAEAYLQLKDSIRSGDLPPGHQVPEPELARQYGVSRSTIREALVRLEAESLVELIPRRGARVLPLSVDDMDEIYEILSLVEPEYAAKIAADHPCKADLDRLEKTIVAMEKALAQEQLDDWAEADDQFHLTLLELFGSERLTNWLSRLNDQAHRARMVTLRMRDLPKQSTKEQREIFEAIRDGDPDACLERFRAHRARSKTELLDILKKTGIRQF